MTQNALGKMMHVLADSSKSTGPTQASLSSILGSARSRGFPQPKYQSPFWLGQFLLNDEDFYHHPEVSVITKNFSTVGRGQGRLGMGERNLRRHV